MSAASPQFSELKSRMKAGWVAGDFGQIAKYIAVVAEEFVRRIDIKPGTRVLDVACGTGNEAIPAAKAGGTVIGVDIAPNLLEQAKARAAAEKVDIRFEEGDAEDLPFEDHSFDVVLSMFGAMFAPRPERVAAEFVRVCRPGGVIAMANWTAEGFVGKSFQLTSKMVPPPPGIPSPVLWGDEDTVRQRFAKGVASLNLTRRKALFDYPFSPGETVEFFRQYMGPIQMTFAQLDPQRQAELASQMEALWSQYNLTKDENRTLVETEYLEVLAIRA